MTDNLVHRLLEGARSLQVVSYEAKNDMMAAAICIEQLNAALRKIANFDLHGDYSNAYEIPLIALAALGEKVQ